MSFAKALERTLGFEGGLSDVAGDRGGRTHYGITFKTYDAYRDRKGLPRRPVDCIDDAEVEEIYLTDYWQPCRCDDLPERLALAVFDMAVNSGPMNARITLQRAVRVRTDGVIGPVTLAAAKYAGEEAVLSFLEKRAAFLQEVLYAHPEDVKFLEGWICRLLRQAWRPA